MIEKTDLDNIQQTIDVMKKVEDYLIQTIGTSKNHWLVKEVRESSNNLSDLLKKFQNEN